MAQITTKKQQVPLRLERDTIAEAIFEIRFEGSVADIGDLLPGMLYGSLKDDYPTLRRLPAGELPKSVREQQPNFKYQALNRLQGTGRSISIGDHVLTLSLLKPYPGWTGFRDQILSLMDVAGRTELIDTVERVALRYTNIIQAGEMFDLSPLDIDLRLNSLERRGSGTHIRAEVDKNDCICVVQVASNANANVPSGIISGLLVDVDTQKHGPFHNFMADCSGTIELIHETEKQVFFGLLTEDTIEALGPVWTE